jgi:hypothetical protein
MKTAKKTSIKLMSVKQIIELLQKGKKVTTANGVAHRLAYCKKVADKTVKREVVVA